MRKILIIGALLALLLAACGGSNTERSAAGTSQMPEAIVYAAPT